MDRNEYTVDRRHEYAMSPLIRDPTPVLDQCSFATKTKHDSHEQSHR